MFDWVLNTSLPKRNNFINSTAGIIGNFKEFKTKFFQYTSYYGFHSYKR